MKHKRRVGGTVLGRCETILVKKTRVFAPGDGVNNTVLCVIIQLDVLYCVFKPYQFPKNLNFLTQQKGLAMVSTAQKMDPKLSNGHQIQQAKETSADAKLPVPQHNGERRQSAASIFWSAGQQVKNLD
jgi:hypothetical protein